MKALSKLLYFISSAQAIQKQFQFGCHNYKSLPVVIKKAQGIFVYDCQNKQYYDCLSAYGAVNQGHLHPKIVQAAKQQLNNCSLVSRAFYNSNLGQFEQQLCNTFHYDKSLLMNSGVEACESAIKFVRRWGYDVKKVQNPTILFAKGNFWGRSIAACASSDDPQRYERFGPYGNLCFKLIQYNNIQSLEDALKQDSNIVGYMVQPIQGEKGIIVPDPDYLIHAHKLLKQYNALLICDQVQTGMGRTGKLICSQHFHVRPDLMVLGKALSGGLYPISTVLADNHIMQLIKPGEHGSTYGGNSLGCKIGSMALKVLIQEGMIENARIMGDYFMKLLKEIFGKKAEVRGKGLFIGVQFLGKLSQQQYGWEFCLRLKSQGVLTKPTHQNKIRLTPPLIIKKEDVQIICDRIKICLDK